MITTEKRFEADIESFFLSPAGGYTKGADTYDAKQGLYVNTLIDFVQRTQPKEWARFENANQVDPVRKFCTAFNTACETEGLLSVLRHGFKHRGLRFRACYFKPESALNQAAAAQWAANTIECYRQWYFSADTKKSVDMVLVLNGIPVFAFELKNQYTGQTVDDAKRQWMYDRDPRELCFQFNKRILAYFCVDHTEVWITTKLAGKNTYFLPFNQGSNGAGNDGGKGNPANPNGYPTAYLWENVFQKDSMMDIVQKFMNLKDGKTLIFPRYHQLDVVRKLLADVRQSGAGHNYLIQHSAGSGKSNSIAWTAYRLASLFNEENKPVFSSVVVVTDRTVLDAQLQETISGFDHTLGAIETIGEDKTSKDLRDAINGGVRIIVTTLQKFPVIYQEVDKVVGRNFAIIVDEAHSSQTGSSALKLKAALADTEDALREYAEIEGKAEEELGPDDRLMREMTSLLRAKGYKQVSLSVQKANPAAHLYRRLGFETVRETEEEYIMIHPLSFNRFMNTHAPDKTTDITFRPATVIDIPELKELFCSTVLTVNVRDYTAEEAADWASCGNRLGHWEKLMATLHFIAACDAEGRIVGFTSIRNDGYLHSMFVHKDHQREGIATALLQRIEAYAMEHGICDITSEVSITARPFFERRGYVVEQEQRAQANRLKLTNYIMKKQLKKI